MIRVCAIEVHADDTITTDCSLHPNTSQQQQQQQQKEEKKE